MTIESQNQILTPKDRLNLRLEKEFKLQNQTPLPDVFDGYVFIDAETEEIVRSARSNAATTLELVVKADASKSANFLKCRVYSDQEHDAVFDNPLEAKTLEDYKHAINRCTEGIIRIDHESLSKLTNGSIWSCRRKGATIQLETLVQASSFSFKPGIGLQKDGSKSFKNSQKNKMADNPRSSLDDKITIQFKDNSETLRSQSLKAPYKDFMPILVDKISKTNFSQSSVIITSLFRGPSAQVNAMIGTRIRQGDSQSYVSFLQWATKTYTKKNGLELVAIIKEKDWSSDVEGLRKKMTAKATEQFNKGRFVSDRMQFGAADIRTKDLEWSDIEELFKAMDALKKEGHITMYQIENERPSPNTAPDSIDPNEHIHFALTKKGGE